MNSERLTTIRLETGEQNNVESKIEVRFRSFEGEHTVDQKELVVKMYDCNRMIKWELPLNLRGLRKLERIKVALELAEKELVANMVLEEETKNR